MIYFTLESVFHDDEDWENDLDYEYTLEEALEELSFLNPRPGEKKSGIASDKTILTSLAADEISYEHYECRYSNTWTITADSETELAPIVDFVRSRLASFDSVEAA